MEQGWIWLYWLNSTSVEAEFRFKCLCSSKKTPVWICLTFHCYLEPGVSLSGDALKLRHWSSLRNFPPVLFSPGWITAEHFDGKQVPFAPPAALQQAEKLIRCLLTMKISHFLDQSSKQTVAVHWHQLQGSRAETQRAMKINDFCNFWSKNWTFLSILEYVRIFLESDMYCTTQKGTQQN